MDFSYCTSLCKKSAEVGGRAGAGMVKRVQKIVRGTVTKIVVIHDAKHTAKQQQLTIS